MRCLRRNMTEFEYLPYDGTETDVNEAGEHTGEFHPAYGDAVSMKGNISTPSGSVNQTFYGADIRYTHTLVMKPQSTPITEGGAVRWEGELYDVQAVRPSLNSLSVALLRQTGDHPQTDEEPETPTEPGTEEPTEPTEPEEPAPTEPTEPAGTGTEGTGSAETPLDGEGT